MTIPTPTPARPVSQRRSESESCPSCGQLLRDQQAVRHLRESELEFERTLEAAVRARIAELAGELAVDLDAKHKERLERLQSHPDVDEEQLASARARHAEDMDKLRVFFRQF